MNRVSESVLSALTILRLSRALIGLLLGTLVLSSWAAGAHQNEGQNKGQKEAQQGDKLPLQSTRTISFETDEATWLSVDVSPTRDELVVDILGDLYQLPGGGGDAVALTVGMGYDSQPQFSPDGEQIVFVSDRGGREDIWVMDRLGANLRKLSENSGAQEFASPSFAPDGKHIIVSRTTWGLRTFELWAYHLDGGKGLRITKAKATAKTPTSQRANALGAVYSADGRYLFYARRNGGFGYNLRMPLWQIARRDLHEGTEVILTAAMGSAFRPQLSPDGTQLTYATRDGQHTALRLRDLNTGDDRLLVAPIQLDEQESRFTRDLLPGYSFTADGSAVVYTADGGLNRVTLATGSVQNLPFKVKVEQALGPELRFPYRLAVGPVKARMLQRPALSPDGKRLAFSAFARIYLHDLEDGTTTRLSPEGMQAFQPTWSPDGKRILFVDWQAGGGHIWSSRAVSRMVKPKQLTRSAAAYYQPAVSADGARVVAFRASGYERLYREADFGLPVGADLVWLPSGGGASQVIVPVQGATRPHFGPEPDRVYYYSNAAPFARGHNARLLSVRYDGSDQRQIFAAKGQGTYLAEDDVSAADMQLSPKGDKVLVAHAAQLYLFSRLGPWLGRLDEKLSAPALPMAKLTDVGADHFGFSADGSEVYWSVGHTLYQRTIADIAFAEDDEEPEEGSGQNSESDKSVKTEVTAAGSAPDFAQVELLENHSSVRRHVIEIYEPRYRPQGSLALVGGTAITMASAAHPEQTIADSVVLIDGDRLAAVGPRGEVEIPAGAKVIDVSGKFLLPGFVDTHAHFRPLRDLMDANNWAFMANLAYGVTTGIDVQPSTPDIIAYEDMIAAGHMLGPRALSTGPGVFSNNAFRSAEHAYAVLRRYKDHYGVRNLKAYISGERQQRQWLVQAARDLRLMATTEGSLDMKLNMTHVLDGFTGNEHNFPVLDLYRDTVQLVARSNIAYTPTLLVLYGGPWAENYFYTRESPAKDPKLNRFTPKQMLLARTQRRPIWVRDEEHRFMQAAASAAKIIRAGGLVGVGSHGQLQGLGYHWELWALASGGLSNAEALRAATTHGAQMIGVSDDLGALVPGKLADVLVLNTNPLADLRATVNLDLVVKGGSAYDADSLDQVWPEVKPLPQQWWQPPPSTAPAEVEN